MIAIIPARGGSKRIPNKNRKLFHGKPIIAYSIEAALKSGLFEQVIVSTDNEEIARIAKECGAEVPFIRSDKNSDDFATTSDVLLEVLSDFEKNGQVFENACCIYPTSPLIDFKDLVQAKALFGKEKFDSLISCVCYSFPIQRAFRLKDNKEILLLQPDLIHTRSQELETTFHDAGSFYFFNVPKFQENKTLWSGRIGSFELPETKVQDIDTMEDWKLAELKYTLLKNA